jgi:hypothetical protein
VQIKQKALGEEDSEAAHTLRELGLVCMDLCMYEEAEMYLARALAIREKVGLSRHSISHLCPHGESRVGLSDVSFTVDR